MWSEFVMSEIKKENKWGKDRLIDSKSEVWLSEYNENVKIILCFFVVHIL